MSESAGSFGELSRERFGDLNASEKKLMQAVSHGAVADYNTNDPEVDRLENFKRWSSSRILRAEFVAWLCTNAKVNALIGHKGVRIKGARIEGQIDLEDAILHFPLVLESCVMLDGIVLRNAVAQKLNFTGSHTGPIDATGLHTRSSLSLCDGFHAQGEVKLLNARIDGDLNCRGGRFENPQGEYAICAERLSVYGNVKMARDFHAKGEVNLLNARIGGNLNCRGGRFENPKGKRAIRAERVSVYGTIQMERGFHASGEVSLAASKIGWGLFCPEGTFENRNGTALSAPGVETQNGSIWLEKIRVFGRANLDKARIRYDLWCNGARFENPGGEALSLKGLAIEGSVFLRKNFRAFGEVSLERATIGGNLMCNGAKISNHKGTALNVQYANIKGALILSDMQTTPKGKVNLHQVKAGHFKYDENTWPEKGNLDIEGFKYEALTALKPSHCKKMRGDQNGAANYVKWLRLQDLNRFSLQPYEQLAVVLRKSGKDADAKKILIAKAKDQARYTEMSFLGRFGHQLLGLTICYGYRPWRAFWMGLIVVALGWGLFANGFRADSMTPTKEWAFVYKGSSKEHQVSQDYPKFNGLVYSLDVFLPLVDLHQVSYWLPNANRTGELHISEKFTLPVSGNLLCFYMWFEIIVGWVLTTLLVVGLTGLVRT